MATDQTVLRIFIASPSDTASERQVISDVVRDWNSAHSNTSSFILQDRRWELDSVPEVGAPPQEILNRQLVDDADIVIAVFSSRLGTPTNDASSGTVEEIKRVASAGKPVLIYFSNASLPRDHDPRQFQLLMEYKDRLKSESLYGEYTTIHDLRQIVTRHLAATIERQKKVESSPWAHYNGQKTSAHNGQQLYEQSIAGNFISHSLPAPWSYRSVVEAIAQHSTTPIPIDDLAALPDQPNAVRGKVLFGDSGEYLDDALSSFSELEWWFSDKGLNITKVSSS